MMCCPRDVASIRPTIIFLSESYPAVPRPFDLAVVGAGIVGLAHAFAAARLGRRVVVIDREPRAVGASIRNFGFVTVTGQERGATWRRARRSRDIWAAIAASAGIAIEQRGLLVSLRHPLALAVAETFLQTEMGEGCRLLSPGERAALPFPTDALAGVLQSPHDLRVESRRAIPRLAAWLEESWGVTFQYGAAVLSAAPPFVQTSRGAVEAEAVVVCPGDDLATLFPERIAARGVTRCTLSMLRLADPGFRLPSAVMSDLGLVRYLGYAALPEAAALRATLERSHAESLAHGVHLIVTQSADGTLIVGDSHHYGPAADPFMSARVETLILEAFGEALGVAPTAVVERWSGTYASADGLPMFVDAPTQDTRLVMVTSGTGASTSFAIAEEVIGALYGCDLTSAPLTPALAKEAAKE
jgi:FAD dependent oxidoreductase TIGR03364